MGGEQVSGVQLFSHLVSVPSRRRVWSSTQSSGAINHEPRKKGPQSAIKIIKVNLHPNLISRERCFRRKNRGSDSSSSLFTRKFLVVPGEKTLGEALFFVYFR